MNLKQCKIEGCLFPRWAKGLCLQHDKIANPYKYQIKPYESGINPSSKPKSSDISNPKQKPIKHISNKQALRLKEYRKLRDAYMKVHTVCEFKGCCKPSEDLHHMKSREYHLCDTDVFMAVCRTHHIWIHDNDSKSRELGYLLQSI